MTQHSSMQRFINSQVRYWREQKAKIDTPDKVNKLPFVTISREYGCGGFEVAQAICEIMNEENSAEPKWAAYDRELLNKIMDDLGLSSSLAETLTSSARDSLTNLIQTSFSKFPPQVSIHKKLVETVSILANNGNVVIVGRAGNVITKDMPSGYHIRIVADLDWKVKNMMNKADLSKSEAEKLVIEKTDQREGFVRDYVKFNVSDPHNYHLVINNAHHGTRETAGIIVEGLKAAGLLKL